MRRRERLEWARCQHFKNPHAKFILMELAYGADEDGVYRLGIDELLRVCESDKANTIRRLNYLQSRGLIRRTSYIVQLLFEVEQ